MGVSRPEGSEKVLGECYPNIRANPAFRVKQNPTGSYVIPMIASSYTLAATVCSLAVTVIGMPLGRRGCILLGNLLVIIGGSLQASAWSVAHMIVGRILCVSLFTNDSPWRTSLLTSDTVLICRVLASA